MMLINLDDLLPLIREHLAALQNAQDAVNGETDPARRKIMIERNRLLWSALREHLERLSFRKCWYTECHNPGTDDDVDHYRPKNSVAVEAGEAPHGGYYWLAFQWRNFRLSCHRGNRLRKNAETGVTGGKSDRFPLLDPAKRLTTPHLQQADLDGEQPLLLDPTRPRDVAILTFNERGLVAVNPRFANDPVEIRRFEESRKCYHLDWPDFREERVQLYNLIEQKVLRGQGCAPSNTTSSLVTASEFDGIIHELRRLMDREKPYSAAARAYLMSFRNHWWVERHVLQIEAPPQVDPRPQIAPLATVAESVAPQSAVASPQAMVPPHTTTPQHAAEPSKGD